MARERKTFDVAKYKLKLPDGTELSTFEFEEYAGEEEIAAADRAGGTGNAVAYQLQLIAESVCAVNGQEVGMRPYLPLLKWSSRTLDFMRKAFNGFCSATNAELADFAKAAFGEAAAGRGASR